MQFDFTQYCCADETSKCGDETKGKTMQIPDRLESSFFLFLFFFSVNSCITMASVGSVCKGLIICLNSRHRKTIVGPVIVRVVLSCAIFTFRETTHCMHILYTVFLSIQRRSLLSYGGSGIGTHGNMHVRTLQHPLQQCMQTPFILCSK